MPEINKQNNVHLDIISQEEVETKESFPLFILGDTLEEAEEVYQKFESYLNKIAYTYATVYHVEKYDVFSEALLGLGKAIKGFDKQRNDSFMSYAMVVIKDTLHEYVRKMSRAVVIPSYIKKTNTVLSRVNDIALPPEEREKAFALLKKAAKRAGLTVEELSNRASVLPSNIEYTNQIDYSDQPNTSPDKKAMLIMTLDKLFKTMTATEKEIAKGLMDDLNQSEIAIRLNVDKAYVSEVLKKFRKRLKRLGIKIEDII